MALAVDAMARVSSCLEQSFEEKTQNEGKQVESTPCSVSDFQARVDGHFASLCRSCDSQHAIAIARFAVERNLPSLMEQFLRSDLPSVLADWPRVMKATLCMAVREGNEAMLEIILRHIGNGGMSDEYERHPLLIAAEQDNLCSVQLLCSHGADVNVAERASGWTAVHYAAEWDSVELVDLLVKFGANVNKVSLDGESPLQIAAHNGHERCVQALLQSGADVRAPNHSGNTALHLAAQEGHAVIVDMLLARNADVNATNRAGETPLHAAAFMDENALRFAPSNESAQVCIIKALLRQGADVGIRDGRGHSVLQRARHGDFVVILELLQKLQPLKSNKRHRPL